jgi:hypothetical protein
MSGPSPVYFALASALFTVIHRGIETLLCDFRLQEISGMRSHLPEADILRSVCCCCAAIIAATRLPGDIGCCHDLKEVKYLLSCWSSLSFPESVLHCSSRACGIIRYEKLDRVWYLFLVS